MAPRVPISTLGASQPSRLLVGAGAPGLVAVASGQTHAQVQRPSADHTIRIAPTSLEIRSDKVIQTTGYNGKVPGLPLRLKEGKPVTIQRHQ